MPPGLQQARLVVAVVTGPAALRMISGAVRHPQQVADLVIVVPLDVAGHRGPVTWLGLAHARRVGRAGRDWVRCLALGLAEVLAAGGFDQPVECIVGVGRGRVDCAVAEEDPLLGVVGDQRGVADRVVGVAQVLQLLLAAERRQGDQAECQRVVGVGRSAAVAIGDQRALAARVVVEARDETGGFGGALQAAVKPVQQARTGCRPAASRCRPGWPC